MTYSSKRQPNIDNYKVSTKKWRSKLKTETDQNNKITIIKTRLLTQTIYKPMITVMINVMLGIWMTITECMIDVMLDVIFDESLVLFWKIFTLFEFCFEFFFWELCEIYDKILWKL